MATQKQTEANRQNDLFPAETVAKEYKATISGNTIKHSDLIINDDECKKSQAEERKENKEIKSKITSQKKQDISNTSLCSNSIVGSALIIDSLFAGSLDVKTLANDLTEKVNRVVDGNLCDVECMLVTQAQTLDAFFKNMLLRASSADLLLQLKTYSEIALKAQSQARKTLGLLAELKNPKRTTFIKQQNNAVNQQVNPVNQSSSLEKTENKTPPSNELLIEVKAHEKLEFRRPSETSTVNTQMETVEKIERSKDC